MNCTKFLRCYTLMRDQGLEFIFADLLILDAVYLPVV